MKKLILALGALLALPILTQAQERLPLEYFVKHDDYHEVKISPDGEYFAVRARQDGQIILAFIRREDMKVTGGARPLNDGDVLTMDWANDERLVYTLTRDFGFTESPLGTGELYAVNRDGARHELIFGQGVTANDSVSRIGGRDNTYGTHEIISLLPDDDKFILIAVYPYKTVGAYAYVDTSASPEVVKLDIYRARQRRVDRLPLPASQAMADSEGNLRFNLGTNSAGDFTILARQPDDSEWQEFKPAGNVNKDASPLAYDSSNNLLYLLDEQGENETDAIIQVNTETSQSSTLYHNENFDYRFLYTHPRTGKPVFVRTHEGRAVYDYLDHPDAPLARVHRTLTKAFKGQAVTITSLTADQKEMVVHVSSDVNPGEFYLFNAETNKASFIMAGRSWVDPRKMRPMEPISLPAADGETLHGYLTKPDDGDGPFPLIVIPHGGPHQVSDGWFFDWEVQLLAHHGYAVLQINYRGSNGYGDRFETAGYGEWGGKMQDDVSDATRWAITQGVADAHRICIYGGSYGAYAALMGAVREPGLYQCAAGFAGVYNLQLMFDKGDILLNRTGPDYLRKVLGEDREKLRQRSPLHRVADIQIPVLLAHGDEDLRVPIDHALAMRDALQQAGKPVEWIRYSREGHGLWNEENRKDFYTRLLAFFATHTRAQADSKNSENTGTTSKDPAAPMAKVARTYLKIDR